MRDQLDFTRKSSPNDIDGIARCEQLAKDANESARAAREDVDVDVDFALAKQLLGQLSTALSAAEPKLASGLRTHLPWSSGRAE